jgi:hypothetical protein
VRVYQLGRQPDGSRATSRRSLLAAFVRDHARRPPFSPEGAGNQKANPPRKRGRVPTATCYFGIVEHGAEDDFRLEPPNRRPLLPPCVPA